MNIIFFAKGDRRLPSSRTRAYLISDYLNNTGHKTAVYHIKTRPWWNISSTRLLEFVRNIKILFSTKKDTYVFLQRTVHQIDFLLLVLVRKIIFKRGYVFDFDDAIFLEKGNSDIKTRLIIRNADLVFCGSRFLKDYAEKINKNSHLVTTIIDTDNIYVKFPEDFTRKEVTIGWSGTPVHYDNMKILVPVITRLVNEGFILRMLLVGGGDKIASLFKSIEGLKVTAVSQNTNSGVWSEPREVVRYIQNFDIGVYPLEDTDWNRGKDAYKAKEFMGCGVATVVSNWGENKSLFTDKTNCLMVDKDGWYEALKKLIVDSKYRGMIASGGRIFTENICSYKSNIPIMLDLISRSNK